MGFSIFSQAPKQSMNLGVQGMGFVNMLRSSNNLDDFAYGGGINAFISITAKLGTHPEINFQISHFEYFEDELYMLRNANYTIKVTTPTNFRFVGVPSLVLYKLSDRLSIPIGSQYGYNFSKRYQVNQS
jgi:hypothetical protein